MTEGPQNRHQIAVQKMAVSGSKKVERQNGPSVPEIVPGTISGTIPTQNTPPALIFRAVPLERKTDIVTPKRDIPRTLVWGVPFHFFSLGRNLERWNAGMVERRNVKRAVIPPQFGQPTLVQF